jgi:primosomal protein N' (replication factor Y) (superfamily II helicase)
MPDVKEPEGQGETYVNIILDVPSRQLDRPFTYQVPAYLAGRVEVGSVVLVPFINTLHIGYVLEFCEPRELPRIRPIEKLIDEPPIFDEQSVELCTWIANNYMSSLSQALRLVVPPGRARRVVELIELKENSEEALHKIPPRAARQREVVQRLAAAGGTMQLQDLRSALGGKLSSSTLNSLESGGTITRRFVLPQPKASRIKVTLVEITDLGRDALLEDPDMESRSPARRRLLQALHEHGGVMTAPELHHLAKVSSKTLQATLQTGLVRTWQEERLRDPFADRSFPQQKPHQLNPEQEAALEAITAGMDSGDGGVFLLHGITGSGKTEVYLHAIDHALSVGRTALVLVPEIALTPQMVQRFKGRLGEEVAVLHSRLGLGERYDQWRGIREGRYKVVIGARSALFAPLRNLGLLVIDEEHETTYKENSAPRYHARDVAAQRARLCGAALVLGSATPRLESLYLSEHGDYRLIELPKRVDDRPLPSIATVDMRELNVPGERTIFSPQLVNELGRVYRAGEQAIIFLNRRGFARFLQCHQCGHIFQCPNCSVSLCFHSGDPHLLCHHCDWRFQPPFVCPQCGNQEHRYAGIGTERVEAELKRLLPPLRCIRMDADTTRHKNAHWDMLEEFKAGKAQVLLGTQMIAKGLDIPNVTLVGVINTDTSLGLPDFRAGERTFQLLTQVSGRAGRGIRPGRVIFQTYSPDHYAIEAAVRSDARTFYQREIAFRREANYPPFCHLINLVIAAGGEDHARAAATGMGEILQSKLNPGKGELLGPAPAPFSRLKGKYRYHLIVKAPSLERVAGSLEESLSTYEIFRTSYCRQERLAKEEISLIVDVDPVSLL